MPDGDLMRATIEGRFESEPIIIGFGFVSSSGLGSFEEDAAALAVALSDLFTLSSSAGPFMSPLSAAYHVDQIRVQDLNPGIAASYTTGVGSVGGNAVDDAMPPNDALCVTWRTGLKGKQNRGRTYLTGFAEDSQSGGYWIGEIQDWAANTVAQPLIDAFGPGSAAAYSLHLVHTQAGGVRLTPPTSTPILSYTVHNEVRTLRRRATGVRISRHRSAP